jgi:hypothetical protein
MAPAVPSVIKKNRVRTASPRPLSPPRPAAPGSAAAAQPHADAHDAAEPSVRIVRQEADRAILEVRCACGQVMCVECRWSAPAVGTTPAPAPTDRVPDPNEEVPR